MNKIKMVMNMRNVKTLMHYGEMYTVVTTTAMGDFENNRLIDVDDEDTGDEYEDSGKAVEMEYDGSVTEFASSINTKGSVILKYH